MRRPPVFLSLLGAVLLILLLWPASSVAEPGRPTPIPADLEDPCQASPKEWPAADPQAGPEEGDSPAQQVAEQLLEDINRARAGAGLSLLKSHPALERAALKHSQEMMDLGYFSHQSPTPGRNSPGQRIAAEGVRPQKLAENLFSCEGFPFNVVSSMAVEQWLQSPGHRRNLLDPAFTHTGLGVAERNGEYLITQVFGAGL